LPVKIRLRRVGAKHQPSYRIVVADSQAPRNGRYLDQVGFYNPLTNPATITLNSEKAVDWLRRGAQPTDTVLKLLSKFNIEPTAVRKGATPAPVEPAEAPSRQTSNRTRPGGGNAAASAEAAVPGAAIAEAPRATDAPEGDAAESTIELAPEDAPEVTETGE
jgi:small subunit ribosomal protein S16